MLHLSSRILYLAPPLVRLQLSPSSSQHSSAALPLLCLHFSNSQLKYWWTPCDPSSLCQQLLYHSFREAPCSSAYWLGSCWTDFTWCRHVLCVTPAVPHPLVGYEPEAPNRHVDRRDWPYNPAIWIHRDHTLIWADDWFATDNTQSYPQQPGWEHMERKGCLLLPHKGCTGASMSSENTTCCMHDCP